MKISVKVDDVGTKAYVTGVEGRLKNMVPALKAIGEHTLIATEGRFERQQDPGGRKWAPLKPSTRRRKKHPKILTESGMLRGTIRYRLMGTNAVAIGTNRPYGRIHQLGGKAGRGRKVTIPARPYLGFSGTDREEIEAILVDHIRIEKGRRQ